MAPLPPPLAGRVDLAHDRSPSNVLPSISRNPSLAAAIRAIDIDTRSENVIKIGTRASMLALIQANLVLDGLELLAASQACPAMNASAATSTSPTSTGANGNGSSGSYPTSSNLATFPFSAPSRPQSHPHFLTSPSPLAFKLAPMSTAGDRNKIEPLYLMGAKALWTKDLEVALVNNIVDCIVHSLKDVPTSLPEGCEIAAVLEREDPRDALVVKAGLPYKSLEELPAGSCVGSSSVRRVAQMRMNYPHLTFKDVRGNIDTRLNKLDAEDGPYDALILASAGLLRSQLGERITGYLNSPVMLHCVGQGAIGIEIRSNDTRMREMISRLNHHDTDLRTSCERSMLRTLEGGCSVPVGVETRFVGEDEDENEGTPTAAGSSNGHANGNGNGSSSTGKTRQLEVRAIIASLDGTRAIHHLETRAITTKADAEQLGHDVAVVLIQRGGKEILEELGRIVEMKNVNGVTGSKDTSEVQDEDPVKGIDRHVASEELERQLGHLEPEPQQQQAA